MKRLTMWYNGNHAICENEACSLSNCPFADPICEQVQNIIDRLAAYEETGLEPEEIEIMHDRYGHAGTLRASAAERLEMVREIPTDRLRELAEADKNKCVIITPYPISEGVIEHDPVQLYRIINNKAKPFEVDTLSISDGECTFEPCEPEHDGMCYGRENMGKDVFLNCIDADAALRREQDGCD